MRTLIVRELGYHEVNGRVWTIVSCRVIEDGAFKSTRVRSMSPDVEEAEWLEYAKELYHCDRWEYQPLLKNPYE